MTTEGQMKLRANVSKGLLKRSIFVCGVLLSLCVSLLTLSLMGGPLARPSEWYFGESVLIVAVAVAIAAWAFHISLGSRKLWKDEFLG